MKNIFITIGKYSCKGIIFVWDFIFFFFGMPYEKQASKLKLDKLDHIFRGTENQQPTHKIYRANKVSTKE